MKITYLFALVSVSVLATTAQSQTSGGGGGGAAAGGTAAAGGAGAGAASGGVAAGATVNGGAAATSQGQINQAPNLPPREQLPPGVQNREQLPPPGRGGLPMTNLPGSGSNSLGSSNQFSLTNRFGTNLGDWRTNRFHHTNDNDFDDTNGFGRTNGFHGTNGFDGRTNRFHGTNDFGGRTNRFGTNTFGFGTNGLSNELSISNSIVLSNQFGLGPTDVGGFVPGVGGATAVGGNGATSPAAAAPAAAAPPETPMLPTGPAGTNRIYGSLANRGTGIALQDRAVTESDRTLLQKVRKLVIPRLEARGAWGPAVHFWIGDGNITMVGTVQSKDARREAEDMVAQLSEVRSVKNNLFVASVDPNASEPDQELLYRVRGAVLPQVAPGSPSSPVDFTVRDGVVTVIGQASSPEQATRIQQMVQQVAGVDHVKNEMLMPGAGTVQASPEISNPGATASTNLPPTGRQPEPAPDPQESQTAPPTPQPQ